MVRRIDRTAIVQGGGDSMHPVKKRLSWAVLLCIWSACSIRFLPPWEYGLVLDDWPNALRAEFFSSAFSAFLAGLDYLTRPLSCAFQLTLFHLIGSSIIPFLLVSFVGHSLCLFLIVRLVWRWSGDEFLTFIMAILFVLLPTVSELNYWPTLIVASVGCSLPAYLLSAVLWVDYVRRPRLWCLAGACVCYTIGLFSYEIGAFLPAAYLFVGGRLTIRQKVLGLLPFACAFGVYGAWRLSGGFGLVAQTYLPPHMRSGFSGVAWWWNIQEYARWWVGAHMGMSIVNGLNGFFTLAPWAQRASAILVLGMGAWVSWLLKRMATDSGPCPRATPQRSLYSECMFPLAWIVATALPLLLGYSASRLQYLPGVGWALLISTLLRRLDGKWLIIPAGAMTAILLAVQLGTAQQWRESGQFHRSLYRHLEKTRSEWREKQVIWFDTESLRARLSGRILQPADANWLSVAQWGNAGLLRGFSVRSMINRLEPSAALHIETVLDVEHWPRVEQGRLMWHGRFDPADVRVTPLGDVYRLDVLASVLTEVQP